jgi:hypothetical protein
MIIHQRNLTRRLKMAGTCDIYKTYGLYAFYTKFRYANGEAGFSGLQTRGN